MKLLLKLSLSFSYLYDMILASIYKKNMKYCGNRVYLRPLSSNLKGLINMSVGDNVSIPKNTTIFCTCAELVIGNNVIFGPKPTIITGDHRINVIGKFIIDIKDNEKLKENDKPVIIEDDVWVGANVTILKGVTIGRGAVIAAGAVVARSVLPYSISGGVIARHLKFRFTIDEIIEHERILYSEDKRYTREQLENMFSEKI